MTIINAWQWDTDIPVRIPYAGTAAPELDFMPDTGTGQTVRPVLSDGILTAQCPPQLLTSSRPIQIYARLGNTIDRVGMICIRPRPKPPNYIDTPADVRTWEILANRIARLEEKPVGGTVTDEQIAAAVDAYLQENPASVQGDWNQNSPDAPDYMKNRTHWVEKVEKVVEWTADSNQLLEGFPKFEAGGTVNVTVDGVKYSLIAYDDGGTAVIGDSYADSQSGSGQFGWTIFSIPNVGVGFSAPSSAVVSYVIEVVHKLDKMYLPETIESKYCRGPFDINKYYLRNGETEKRYTWLLDFDDAFDEKEVDLTKEEFATIEKLVADGYDTAIIAELAGNCTNSLVRMRFSAQEDRRRILFGGTQIVQRIVGKMTMEFHSWFLDWKTSSAVATLSHKVVTYHWASAEEE